MHQLLPWVTDLDESDSSKLQTFLRSHHQQVQARKRLADHHVSAEAASSEYERLTKQLEPPAGAAGQIGNESLLIRSVRERKSLRQSAGGCQASLRPSSEQHAAGLGTPRGQPLFPSIGAPWGGASTLRSDLRRVRAIHLYANRCNEMERHNGCPGAVHPMGGPARIV